MVASRRHHPPEAEPRDQGRSRLKLAAGLLGEAPGIYPSSGYGRRSAGVPRR
ncbi:MAG: hypothetical protein AVDCRST_MAG49-3191 [uncultured Thermomicrobiales bacterium]|uniref:Uncharacterized protein n=1 Tax=uncultured Thermomicrobiales bacterium TaxID=1645740 RepID=A0A6J4V7Y7_9BACT|nr:MAG: hypothetical protein AVDCRST_MAG49-3191 [uncultured Thermomicrobiales bacterium]